MRDVFLILCCAVVLLGLALVLCVDSPATAAVAPSDIGVSTGVNADNWLSSTMTKAKTKVTPSTTKAICEGGRCRLVRDGGGCGGGCPCDGDCNNCPYKPTGGVATATASACSSGGCSSCASGDEGEGGEGGRRHLLRRGAASPVKVAGHLFRRGRR